MMKAKYYYVHVTFETGSHTASTHTTKAKVIKAAKAYEAWAKENAQLMGYPGPSHTSVDVWPSDQHMGPF